MFDALFPSHWSDLQKLMWLKILNGGLATWETISGNPVSFTAKAAPLRQLSVAFSPVQDLHGYDSPWPAGGGKNKTLLTAGYNTTTDGITVELLSTGEIYIHGTSNKGSGYTSFEIGSCPEALEGQTVTVSVNEKTSGIGFAVGSGNGNINLTMSDTTTSKTGEYTAGGNRFLRVNVSADVANIDKKYKFQVEVGSTPTSFAPYSNICPISGWDSLNVYHSGADTSNPQTISISLGSTVYSGTVDVVTGVVTVTGKLADCGDFNYSKVSNLGVTFFYCALSDGERVAYPVGLCSAYPMAQSAPIPDKHALLYGRASSNFCRFAIHDDTYLDSTPAEFKAAVTGIKFTYPLATPIEIQLTPQEVESLAGDNTMWTDAQNLEVTYRKN